MASPHLNPSPCETAAGAVQRRDPITPLSCGVKGLAPDTLLYPTETQVFLQSLGSSEAFRSCRGTASNTESHSPVPPQEPALHFSQALWRIWLPES